MIDQEPDFTSEQVRLMEEHFASGRVSVQLNIRTHQLERVCQRPYFREWEEDAVLKYSPEGWGAVPLFRTTPTKEVWSSYLKDRNSVEYNKDEKVLKIKEGHEGKKPSTHVSTLLALL